MKQDGGLLCCYLSRPSGRRDPGTVYLRSSAGWRSPFRHQNMFVDSYQFFRALTQLTFEPRNGFLLRENQNRALCFLPRIHEPVKSEENFSVSRRGVWLVDGNIGTSHQRCLSQRRNRPNRSVQAQIKNQSRYMGIIDSYLAIRRDEWNCGFRKRLG